MKSDRIAQRAGLLAHLATALLVVLPLGAAWALATGGVTADTLRANYSIQIMQDDPGAVPLLIWFTVEAAKLALLMWIIWCVRTWLRACARGQVFTGQTARYVQRIGSGLLVLATAHIVGHTVIVAALTWANPPGQRAFSISFGSTELFLLLTAGLMTLFGWIQAEAARLAAENERFV